MQLGLRPRADHPEKYKDFFLLRNHGRFYGVPAFLGPEDIADLEVMRFHPAAVGAGTLEELQALIDDLGDDWRRQEPLGSYEGYDLVRYRGRIHGVPHGAGPLDLDLEDERLREGVLGGRTVEEVRERVRALRGRVPVEFAGWLPIYNGFGNCGKHPQFAHTATPPPGYHFKRSGPPTTRRTRWDRVKRRAGEMALLALWLAWALIRMFLAAFRSGPRVSLRGRARVLWAAARLTFRLLRAGTRLDIALRFVRSRHLTSQLMLADHHGLTFLASVPYTFNQNPWVIEIEDPTTLFAPFVPNGATCNLRIAESPWFPPVRALLESDQCRGIITHIRSTARLIPTLFGSEAIARKVFYAPLGVKLPERWQRHDEREAPEHINLLLINSWCQQPGNIKVRGGLDVLEAFAIVHERYPHVRLTIRSTPDALDDHYHELMEANWVRVIDRFLTAQEMEALHAESHIFLLPAARVHIVSLLQAMAAGLAVVTSDGWGIEEYVTHERNGLIVKGRYGKTSWADAEAGMLREDYLPICTPDPEVIGGLVEAISRLVEDADLRRRLGRTARRDVETTYSLERWNQGLKVALDRALAGEPLAQAEPIVTADEAGDRVSARKGAEVRESA
jgi:glycosyltransferase involved in cell wall biosynthesis